MDSSWGRIRPHQAVLHVPVRGVMEHFLQIAHFGFPSGVKTVKKGGLQPGKSLWRVWNLPAKTGSLGEYAHATELVTPRTHQSVCGRPFEVVQRLPERLPDQLGGLIPVVLGPSFRLGHDRVDHP